MKKRSLFPIAACVFFISYGLLAGRDAPAEQKKPNVIPGTLRFEGERHLANVRQLTFGGENAEAYFNSEGRKLIFQSTRDSFQCDQIFTMNIDGSELRLVSTGKGRTTCPYFVAGRNKIIYSSTHLSSPDCPPKPDYSRGYVWPLYKSYDLFIADPDGANPVPLAPALGYDAEATVSPDGSKVVFTSDRDGDLDLYLMDTDGSNLRRLTYDLGYDGGAFFGPDNHTIVYRGYHPKKDSEIQEYKKLLEMGLIRPSVLDLYTINSDGTGKFQVTNFNVASFCPYFAPDGEHIIFSSNLADPRGRNFDLYTIRRDGKELERITFCPSFDGFPMFDSEGKRLVFCSNRNNSKPYETNVFIADWIP